METKKELMRGSALALVLLAGGFSLAAQGADRPEGACDIYAAAGTPCVAAHSTTRALYAKYNGPLYQVIRRSDGKTLNIGVVQPNAADGGGYADAAAQDTFCADTTCSISVLYDQSGHHNDLVQPPRGGFSGPSLGGFNNLPVADMAPITVMGHKAYGVFIAPGMGLRQNDAKDTAVDAQAEGMYWVINGEHFNNGCCFDYGNGETDSHDDGNGTMETLYFGNSTGWIHGVLPGPWIMTDQENNLVGCVNDDHSKLCPALPAVQWRFATAFAKGKPHQWAMMVGDAQKPNSLKVTYDGKRVDGTYDPMRLQGAILLGNGGDNSNGSQGTFYEGAMTAADTYPTAATERKLQENIVAAGYGLPFVSLSTPDAVKAPTGLQTFTPGETLKTTITYTNSTNVPANHVKLSLSLPHGWKATEEGTRHKIAEVAGSVLPGKSVSVTFDVTSGTKVMNGDLLAKASWHDGKEAKTATGLEKIRNVAAVKINEFRVSDGTENATNSFIELYNASGKTVDLSGWSLTEHAEHAPVTSAITVPAGTKVMAHGIYLLGEANSGLVVKAAAKDTTLYVRNADGMKAGDTVVIGSGKDAETAKIASVGTAATHATTVWQPAEDPVMTVAVGATNVPVENIAGFKVGEKIALGYGTSYPVITRNTEQFEVATVTAVGKPGTQGYLEAEAPAGATVIQTQDIANLSVGDKIRLDIASKGHGIETVTVKHIGTAAQRSYVAEAAKTGADSILLGATRDWWGGPKLDFHVGAKLDIGTPGNLQQVTITKVEPEDKLVKVSFDTPLKEDHIIGEFVVQLGTGVELAAPLKFAHAANMPFSARGTGISFAPAAKFAHKVNEPVVALGTGITLTTPLKKAHATDAVVHDATVKTAGYQDAAKPNQLFGGPALDFNAGSMILRDAHGHVVDSLNYGHNTNNGNLVDPWAAEGYHGISGEGKAGCFVATPGSPVAFPVPLPVLNNVSASRYPDGADTDSNCTDFHEAAYTQLSLAAAAGTDAVRVNGVTGFKAGETVYLGTGADQEKVKIASVGTAGAVKLRAAVVAGATEITVDVPRGIKPDQEVIIGSGDTAETAVLVGHKMSKEGPVATLKTPLKFAHAAGEDVTGTGLKLAAPTQKAHGKDAQIVSYLPTPGAANVVK